MKKFLFTTVALAACSAALAEYPDKPVTIVVPFAAGGPTDKVARDLAEALRKPLNATIIIENATGAGGTLGAGKVANKVIQAMKSAVETTLFPGRKETPKTLIFAKTDSHADDIVLAAPGSLPNDGKVIDDKRSYV